MVLPVVIDVFNKNFVRTGVINDPIAFKASPRFNAKGLATLTLGLDNVKLGLLMESGSRVIIWYHGLFFMSGPVRSRQAHGPNSAGSVDFVIEDDFRLFSRTLGWPTPTNAIGSQTTEYDVVTGPAETVVKTLVQRNAVNRLGQTNIVIAPDLGRGATITANMRMDTLETILFPLADHSGIGVTVQQQNGALVLDCYTPSLYPRDLTEASGVITDWSWTNDPPEATNVVVGAYGEGIYRKFGAYSQPDRITEWGDVVEVFKEASNIGSLLRNLEADIKRAEDNKSQTVQSANQTTAARVAATNKLFAANRSLSLAMAIGNADEIAAAQNDVDTANAELTTAQNNASQAASDQTNAEQTVTDLQAQIPSAQAELDAEMYTTANSTLLEKSEKNGLKVSLSETDNFRYGHAVKVGDRVTVRIGPGIVVTDTLTQVDLSWTAEEGLVVTPTVGEITNNTDAVFAKALRANAQRIRSLESGK